MHVGASLVGNELVAQRVRIEDLTIFDLGLEMWRPES
jgi:hypothetical protein